MKTRRPNRNPNRNPGRLPRPAAAHVESLEQRRLLAASPIHDVLVDFADTPVSEGGVIHYRLQAEGPALSWFNVGAIEDQAASAFSGYNLRGLQFDASGHFDSNALPAAESDRIKAVFYHSGLSGIDISLSVAYATSSHNSNPNFDRVSVSRTVQVANVAPELAYVSIDPDASAPSPYPANHAFLNDVVAYDIGDETNMAARVDWGDGQSSLLPMKPAPYNFHPSIDTSGLSGAPYVLDTDAVFPDHYYQLNGDYTITITVNDGDDDTATVTTPITIDGAAPELDTTDVNLDLGVEPDSDGYPTEIDEGTVVTAGGFYKVSELDAGVTVFLDWDDGSDLQQQYVPADQLVDGRAAFSFAHRYLDESDAEPDSFDSRSYPQSLATDDLGHTSTYGFFDYLTNYGLVVRNVAPTAELTPAADHAVVGEPFALTALVSDPGILDSQTLVIDWGDGTSESFDLAADGTSAKTLALSHIYAETSAQGTPYAVSVTTTDNDGGTSTTAAQVSVVLPPPPPPPANPVAVAFDAANGTLALTGTDADDSITLRNDGNGLVGVTGNGQDLGSYAANLVVIEVGGGDDDVDGSAVAVSLVVRGGDGDDSLVGGSKSDLLVGDAGDDILRGGAGFWDVLTGGAGNDLLSDPDGVFSAVAGGGDDVIDLRFSKDWAALPGLSPTNAYFRVSPGLIQGNAGSDVIRLRADAGNPAIYFALAADDLVGGAAADTVVLLGNYRNGSTVLLDPLFNTNPGYTPGYDHIFGSHGGVGTGWDHTFGTFANEDQANAAVDAAIAALLDGFRD